MAKGGKERKREQEREQIEREQGVLKKKKECVCVLKTEQNRLEEIKIQAGKSCARR